MTGPDGTLARTPDVDEYRETVTLWAVCRRVWWPPEVGGIYLTEDAARAARDDPDPTDTDWRVVPWTVELPPAIAVGDWPHECGTGKTGKHTTHRCRDCGAMVIEDRP